MIFTPRKDQAIGIKHLSDNPAAGLFLDLGMGKTVQTLTNIVEMMEERLEVNKALVICPKKVALSVWHTEAAKWEHTKHLRFSLILGTEKQRKEALRAKADVYVINCENVVWLVSHLGGAFPFDYLVLDELSKFKNAKAARFKALKTIRPYVKRVAGLTGTPMPNSLLDLWPQMYLLDQGKRLGKTLGGYREQYFKPGRRNGHVIYEYNLLQGDEGMGKDIYEKEIFDKIKDICISMKASDWLQLPEFINQDVVVDLSPETFKAYKEFEKKLVLSIPDGGEITALSAAGLSTKLRQFANGAVYRSNEIDNSRDFIEVHTEKLDRLAEDIEAADGKPFLLFYQFQHDLQRIMHHLKEFKPVRLKTAEDMNRWNRKEIALCLVHAAGDGHGLNLQYGGHHMGWFGVDWNLENYLQACGRLLRPGQTAAVFNRRYICKGTIEERVLQALVDKNDAQDALLDAVKAIRYEHTGIAA